MDWNKESGEKDEKNYELEVGEANLGRRKAK